MTIWAVIQLIGVSLFSVVLSAIVFLLDDKTSFGKMSYITRQICIGILFGAVAIYGTEFGIPSNGVMINCRDAAPMAAGLLFGAPAGIIAGIIGGVERWFAVLWGVGSFTRLACSVSTIIAGFYSAWLRKFMFENKHPSWTMAFGCGIIIEIFHMSMVFITNIGDATKAIKVVDACYVPMVLSVGISVMLSVITVSILDRGENIKAIKGDKRPLFTTVQNRLLVTLSIAFILSVSFTYMIQYNMARNNAKISTTLETEEMGQDIIDKTDSYMIDVASMVGKRVTRTYDNLELLCKEYSLREISVINEDGIIISSNIDKYIGYDMKEGTQSKEFWENVSKENEYVQPYGAISTDENVYRKYAGIADGNVYIQIGYDKEQYHEELDYIIRSTATNRHIGNDGGVFIITNEGTTVSVTDKIKGLINNKMDLEKILDNSDKECFIMKLGGKDYYTVVLNVEGYYVMGVYSVEESYVSMKVAIYVLAFSLLIVFAVLYAVIFHFIKKRIVNQITEVTESLSQISAGNLDEVINVRTNKEFSSLSDDINSTVDTLKKYIAEASARIDAELDFAKTIQEAALPNHFPAFPSREDFDIYARMDTAKEVGGDFYDFYLTDSNHLMFLIADVSDKGIPAAMFMMRAKSILKSLSERRKNVGQVFTEANNELCANNDAGMFVTAWQVALNLETGHSLFANAGHELPAIKHKGGKFELYKQNIDFVLGAMEDIEYTANKLRFEHGDIVFLYTDGVTEAINPENEQFGEQRLLDVLNAKEYDSLKEMCDSVKASIDEFARDAKQFDDITMVAFMYK